MLPEPIELLRQSIVIAPEPPGAVPLITQIFTRENAETYLANAVR